MRALIVAAILAIASTSAHAEGEEYNCHHDGKEWVGCTAHGAPSVDPDRFARMKAPEKGASPGEGCTLVNTAEGTQRWKCPMTIVRRHQQ